MSYIEYKNIKKSIVVLATQKLNRSFCLPNSLDSYVAYGIMDMSTKAKRR